MDDTLQRYFIRILFVRFLYSYYSFLWVLLLHAQSYITLTLIGNLWLQVLTLQILWWMCVIHKTTPKPSLFYVPLRLNFCDPRPPCPAQTERGLQWFKMSFRLPDNSITNSYCLTPRKGEWSYRRRAISNKQSKKTLHHSSAGTEQLKR